MTQPITAPPPGDNGFNRLLAGLESPPPQVSDQWPGAALCAPRLVIRLPMRYRIRGTDRWNLGGTDNLSQSGVAFQTDRSEVDFVMAPPLPDGSVGVEMVLEPPGAGGAGPKAVFSCWGVIARVSRVLELGSRTNVAISLRSPYVPR